MQPDPIDVAELDAYLDGELDLSRQLAVESYLAGRPDVAARFMADLRTRTALRLRADDLDDAHPVMLAAASLLARRLNTRTWVGLRRPFALLTTAGIAFALLLAVVAGRTVTPALPDFVTDAVISYHTGLLRAAMVSQIESPRFDQSEIQKSTHIRIPHLPADWKITDAQIFPSDEGPALQLMIRTAGGQALSIFAVRAGSAAPRSPTAIRHGEASVAYWQVDDMSYALIGMESPEALDRSAEDLADNLVS